MYIIKNIINQGVVMKHSFFNWTLTCFLAFGITLQVSANQLKLDVSAIHNDAVRILLDSSVLYTGDQFKLTISASSDMYVSIFNIDSNNETYLINTANQLIVKNKSAVFPSIDSSDWFELMGDPGSELIVVVGSKQKHDIDSVSDLVASRKTDSLKANEYEIQLFTIVHRGNVIAEPSVNVFLQSKQNSPDNSEVKLSPGMLDKLKQRLRDSDTGTEALQELLWNAKHGSLNDEKLTRGVKEVSLFKKTAPSVVRVYTRESTGTGFFVENSDLILTNAHVVGTSRFLRVALMPKARGQLTRNSFVDGWVVSIDEEVDLALIQLVRSVAKVKPLELASNDSLEIGQDVHAIGHPKTGALWSYTKGYIGQLIYDYQWDKESKAKLVIQSQTPIYYGNSGGPLLNDEGLVVGVNTFGSAEYSGVNNSVSAGDVRLFLRKDRKKPEAKEKDSEATAISEEWAANVVLVSQSDYFMDGVLDTLYYIDDDFSGYSEEVYIKSGKANGGWAYEYDSDEDGLWNEKGIDSNSNRFWELILHDDEEEDGVPDWKEIDLNDDGEIDEWESLE